MRDSMATETTPKPLKPLRRTYSLLAVIAVAALVVYTVRQSQPERGANARHVQLVDAAQDIQERSCVLIPNYYVPAESFTYMSETYDSVNGPQHCLNTCKANANCCAFEHSINAYGGLCQIFLDCPLQIGFDPTTPNWYLGYCGQNVSALYHVHVWQTKGASKVAYLGHTTTYLPTTAHVGYMVLDAEIDLDSSITLTQSWKYRLTVAGTVTVPILGIPIVITLENKWHEGALNGETVFALKQGASDFGKITFMGPYIPAGGLTGKFSVALSLELLPKFVEANDTITVDIFDTFHNRTEISLVVGFTKTQ